MLLIPGCNTAWGVQGVWLETRIVLATISQWLARQERTEANLIWLPKAMGLIDNDTLTIQSNFQTFDSGWRSSWMTVRNDNALPLLLL